MLRVSECGSRVRRLGTATTAAALSVLVASCAGGGSGAAGGPGGDGVATESEWRTLASPRPTPLAGAVRLSFSGVELPTDMRWASTAGMSPELGLSELVVAGLLRRRDVEFVERRRFAAAADAERSGAVRPRGSPVAGVSRGAELAATAIWLPLGGGQASLEVRLANLGTGAIAGARRKMIPHDAEPVGAARAVVAAILETLDEIGRLPDWIDPLQDSAPGAYSPSGVSASSVVMFWEGLAAEERWNWEPARRSYQSAQSASGATAFFEAAVALARTARLRAGGTLGES